MTVLKTVGLVLAGILALFFLILFLVLFVPVRFRLDGALKDGKTGGTLRGTWLLHLVRMELKAEESHFSEPEFFICGIPLRKQDPQEQERIQNGDKEPRGQDQGKGH